MEPLKIWNSFNQPPRSALKEIAAGRMKGKSDINPQWRYKAMTEAFGIVGIGWKFTVDRMWTEPAANGETMAFVNISVFVKVDDKWSDAIPGTGGATLIVSESKGMYNDDDAYKKATTDALSTAMKMLGVAADIYMGLWDGAKYKEVAEATKAAMTYEQASEVKTPKGTLLISLTDEQLAEVLTSKNEEIVKAAKIIINKRKEAK